MALSRDDIKGANDSAPKTFQVEEWGGEVLVSWPTVDAMAAIADKADDVDGLGLLIACVVDEDGAPLFDEADREWLGGKNSAVVTRIVTFINSMFEALEGNSESGPGAATSSD